MADPISIVGLIADVSHIISRLMKYAQAVQSARSEIQKLNEELFALKGILEHLSQEVQRQRPELRQAGSSDLFDRKVVTRVLETTNEIIQSIIKGLEAPETKSKSLSQKLKWPFTQKEADGHLAQLERVKSWLILVLMADHVSVDRDLESEISSLARSVNESLHIQKQERNKRENEELFKWIAPVNPANIHLRASKAQNIGTGKWFIDGHLWKWIRNEKTTERILFLVGKSGLGKTTLFAQTVEELTTASQDSTLRFAYFYCTIGDTASQDPRNILGSLVAQLSGYDLSILDEVRRMHGNVSQNQAHRQPIDMTALEDAIVKCTSGTEPVLLLIDAINESCETVTIERLLSTLANRSPNIRILVTTTSVRTSDLPPYAKTLNVSAEMMQSDIYAFIQHRLNQDDTLKCLSAKLKAEMERTLLFKADGSFRWVQLSLDNLRAQRAAKSMRDTLQNLPGTLRETYVNTLARIAPADRKFVREALWWLSFVKTPLTLSELNEAVVMDEKSTVLDEDMMLLPPNVLLHISQGLITIDESGHVSLAHSSVNEFLTSKWIRESPVAYFSLDALTANSIIVRRCLTYLCLENFKSGYAPSVDDHLSRLEEYRFLNYAAHYWPIHAAACKLDRRGGELVNKFFKTSSLPNRGNFGVWVQTLIPGVDTKVIETTQPLYYAASFGMTSVVKAIIASDPNLDINARGGRTGATPVFIAAWRKYFDVVDILLRAGADPTIADPETEMDVLDLVDCPVLQFAPLRDILAKRGHILNIRVN